MSDILGKDGTITNGALNLFTLTNGMTLFCEEATINPDHSIEFDPSRALFVEFINTPEGKKVKTTKFSNTMVPATKIKFPPASVFQMQNISSKEILDGFRGNLSGLVLIKP